jgi:hypothetical protein
MSTTVNFTGSVDRDLLKRAKVVAAKSETSINALFNAELRYLVETFEAAEAAGNQNFRKSLDFSLGRINTSDLAVMEALGIDSHEDLFLLMAHRPTCRCRGCPTPLRRKWWIASRLCPRNAAGNACVHRHRAVARCRTPHHLGLRRRLGVAVQARLVAVTGRHGVGRGHTQ